VLGSGSRRGRGCRIGLCTVAACKGPTALEDTDAGISEEGEEALRKIETTIGTARALINDLTGSSLAIGCEGNGFTTVWTGIATPEHGGIQCNDKGTGRIITATSGSPNGNVIVGESR
jgi:hypothetical protein